MSDVTSSVACVVVDYHAGAALTGCIDSLHANHVTNIVVVENGLAGSTPPALGKRDVVLVEPGQNLGYGRGVNRGAAATGAAKYLLVANPDLVVSGRARAARVTLATKSRHPHLPFTPVRRQRRLGVGSLLPHSPGRV